MTKNERIKHIEERFYKLRHEHNDLYQTVTKLNGQLKDLKDALVRKSVLLDPDRAFPTVQLAESMHLGRRFGFRHEDYDDHKVFIREDELSLTLKRKLQVVGYKFD